MIDEDASARIKDVTKLFIAKSINLSIFIAKSIRQLILNWLSNEKFIITFNSVLNYHRYDEVGFAWTEAVTRLFITKSIHQVLLLPN